MRCFDGHCDTLARCMTTGEGLRQNGGHVNLARCAALGQHAQIFAVFADSSKTSAPLYTVAQQQHALLERECARNADLVCRCRTARDVRALYAHQMLPDVSHLSEAAAWDVVRLGLGPVIASHANSRAVCAHTRNVSDDLFRAIRDSGGVVGLNLYTDFLGGGMDAVVRHVEHLLDLGGDRTLALGGDLDGCDTLGGGITGVQDYPKLYAAIKARGYDAALLQDLFADNWLRVLPK